MRFWVVVLAGLLAGCSMALNPFGRDREPDSKAIVTQYIQQIFQNSRAVRDVAISRADTVPGMGPKVWRVCLQADVQDNLTGRFGGQQVYAIIIQDDHIVDRRLALPTDGCDAEIYEPMKL
jgi:hypothetical protein